MWPLCSKLTHTIYLLRYTAVVFFSSNWTNSQHTNFRMDRARKKRHCENGCMRMKRNSSNNCAKWSKIYLWFFEHCITGLIEDGRLKRIVDDKGIFSWMRFNTSTFQTSAKWNKNTKTLIKLSTPKNNLNAFIWCNFFGSLTFLYILHLLIALQQNVSIFVRNFHVVYRLRCNHDSLLIAVALRYWWYCWWWRRCSDLSITIERYNTNNGWQTKAK